MPINFNKAELSSCQIKISPEHMKVLRDDLDSKDDRALKEIVAFLIVFGKPLYECLEKEYKEGIVRSYLNLVDSLLVAYGI